MICNASRLRYPSGMHLRHAVFITLLTVFNGSFAQVEISDFERGLTAIEMGNPGRAYQLWLPLAEAGKPNAQFGLGMMHMDGIGVTQDFDEALYWLFKAADQGFAPAQFHLGKAYERGIGLEPDIKRAIHWWALAAEQQLGAAQYRLGQIYWDGEGVPVDQNRARRFFAEAKANGEFISSEYRDALAQTAPASHPPQPQPATTETPSCASWLASVNDDGYTLQLVAGHKQSSVTYFMQQHSLPETHAVCAYQERNQVWFGLFYGHYPTLDAARHALENLPTDLKASQPYLRKLSKLIPLIQLGTTSP